MGTCYSVQSRITYQQPHFKTASSSSLTSQLVGASTLGHSKGAVHVDSSKKKTFSEANKKRTSGDPNSGGGSNPPQGFGVSDEHHKNSTRIVSAAGSTGGSLTVDHSAGSTSADHSNGLGSVNSGAAVNSPDMSGQGDQHGDVFEDPVDELSLAFDIQHISDRENIEMHEQRLKSTMIPQSAPGTPATAKRDALRSSSMRSIDDGDGIKSPKSHSRRVSLSAEFNLPGEGGMRRANSTGTLFVDSTVSALNKDDTLSCIALAIHYIIVDGHNQVDPQLYSERFDEMLHPLTDDRVPNDYDRMIPSDLEIYTFMNQLFDAAALSAECGIVTLVYVNRCIQYTDLAVHASNWKRVLLGAIMMASKVWDDQAVWNVDYCSILPRIDVDDINELERTLLEMLQFNINVDSSVYTKYYFDLRSLAEEADRPFPLEPISTETAARLEASAKHVRDTVLKSNLRNAKSMDYKEFSSKAVLP